MAAQASFQGRPRASDHANDFFNGIPAVRLGDRWCYGNHVFGHEPRR
jgi:hypothetical protein